MKRDGCLLNQNTDFSSHICPAYSFWRWPPLPISIPQLRMVNVCKKLPLYNPPTTLPVSYAVKKNAVDCCGNVALSWLCLHPKMEAKQTLIFLQKFPPLIGCFTKFRFTGFTFLYVTSCHKLDNLLEEVPSWLWLLEQSRGVPSLKNTSILPVQHCSLCCTVGAFKEYCLCHLSWKVENKFNLHVSPIITRDMCCRAF